MQMTHIYTSLINWRMLQLKTPLSFFGFTVCSLLLSFLILNFFNVYSHSFCINGLIHSTLSFEKLTSPINITGRSDCCAAMPNKSVWCIVEMERN